MSNPSPEPIKTIARRRRRDAAIGGGPCLLCDAIGYEVVLGSEVRDLVETGKSGAGDPSEGSVRDQIRLVVEAHHLDGRGLDEVLTVPLCRNCHAAVHALLRDVGIDLRRVELPTPLHRTLARRRTEAIFFRQLAESRSREADELAAFIDRLDAKIPAWRAVTTSPR